MAAANPPVHCLMCGSLLDWEQSNWSIGPESRKVHIGCKCGALTTVETVTHAEWLRRFQCEVQT